MSKSIEDVVAQIESMWFDIDVLKRSHVDLHGSYVTTLKSLSEMTNLSLIHI